MGKKVRNECSKEDHIRQIIQKTNCTREEAEKMLIELVKAI